MPESKFWVFTINNPSEDDEQLITDFLDNRSFVDYGIFGREVGESGTPHLQGFVILNRSRRLSFLSLKVPRAHWEQRYEHSTNEQARDYCKKDGDFEEFGTFPETAPGRRVDLDDIIAWVDDFARTNGRAPCERDFAVHQPVAFVRFPRLVELAALRAGRPTLENGVPNDWQRELAARLDDPADDRTIDFIVDPTGGKGKTWFCRWMLSHNDATQVLEVGRKVDLAYILDTTKSIFLFNVGRNQMEYLSYPLLESLKDRMVTSTKYSGKHKIWTTRIHVVVFSNEYPDTTKLTGDRYDVTTL